MSTPRELVRDLIESRYYRFDSDDGLDTDPIDTEHEVGIRIENDSDYEYVKQIIPIPFIHKTFDDFNLGVFNELNARDILFYMYGNDIKARESKHPLYYQYKRLCGFRSGCPTASVSFGIGDIPKLRILLEDAKAIMPSKERATDQGYDLSIIRKHKQLCNNIAMYYTGVAVQPPPGFYVEVVPRSSISKLGYSMSNSIGIIDQSYTGPIYVSLTRTTDDPTVPTIDQLLEKDGFVRIAQLILRESIHYEVEQVSEITQTGRRSGGFGSTDKQKNDVK